MTALITDTLKKRILQDLYDDVTDSAGGRYYIGIGRSEDWDSSDTAPTPINTLRERRNVRLALQSVKSAADVSFAVPRYNWASGTLYSGYDDDLVGYPTNSYYVLTGDNSVYICLKRGKDNTGADVTSTAAPSGYATTSFKTSDGYVWKYLFTLTASYASKYLSANYLPVKAITSVDSDSPANDISQKAIQDAAIVGQIANIKITSGGIGYSTAPTVTIVGDGDSAEAFAIVSGGNVVDIRLDSDGSGNIKHGTGYTRANVLLTGGGYSTIATARPTLSPPLGFGGDPRDDLKATALMFNTKPSGAESGSFITDNDFRQVALFRNPLIADSDGIYQQAAGSSLRTLKVASTAVSFSADNTILGASSGAKAFVDTVATDTIYYHQTEATGFNPFTSGESITETDGAGSGTLDSSGTWGNGDVSLIDYTKSELLYLENRAAVTRAADQTEDIKVIIRL